MWVVYAGCKEAHVVEGKEGGVGHLECAWVVFGEFVVVLVVCNN